MIDLAGGPDDVPMILKDMNLDSCISVDSNSSFNYSLTSHRLEPFIFNVHTKHIQCSSFTGMVVKMGNINACSTEPPDICAPMVSSSQTLCQFLCSCTNCKALSITFETEGLNADSEVCEFVIWYVTWEIAEEIK